MFCNTQDIEVKVQYILHEANSRVLPYNPRPLCLQAHKIWAPTKCSHVWLVISVLIGWRLSIFSLFFFCLFTDVILNRKQWGLRLRYMLPFIDSVSALSFNLGFVLQKIPQFKKYKSTTSGLVSEMKTCLWTLLSKAAFTTHTNAFTSRNFCSQ